MSEIQTPTQHPPFLLSGVAAIRHLNLRKEGPEDEKVLAVDVKLTFKQVDRRLCAYFDEALEPFLWRSETDALIVRNAFLPPVIYANEINGATVQIGTHTFFGCDVKKFGIEPADGGVITLTRSVSLYLRVHRADAPLVTNREVALLSNLFNLAVERGDIDRNPCKEVRRNKELSRTRLDEHRELEPFVAWALQQDPSAVALVSMAQFAALAESRRIEFRNLHWSQADVCRVGRKGGCRAVDIPRPSGVLRHLLQAAFKELPDMHADSGITARVYERSREARRKSL